MARKKDITKAAADFSIKELQDELNRRRSEEKEAAELEELRSSGKLEKKFLETVNLASPKIKEQVNIVKKAYSDAKKIAEEAESKAIALANEYGIPFQIYVSGITNCAYTPKSFYKKWATIDTDLLEEYDMLVPSHPDGGWWMSAAC